MVLTGTSSTHSWSCWFSAVLLFCKFLPKKSCHFQHYTLHSIILYLSPAQDSLQNFSQTFQKLCWVFSSVYCKLLHTHTFGAHTGSFDVRVQFVQMKCVLGTDHMNNDMIFWINTIIFNWMSFLAAHSRQLWMQVPFCELFIDLALIKWLPLWWCKS